VAVLQTAHASAGQYYCERSLQTASRGCPTTQPCICMYRLCLQHSHSLGVARLMVKLDVRCLAHSQSLAGAACSSSEARS
jgi:hypothetical protein